MKLKFNNIMSEFEKDEELSELFGENVQWVTLEYALKHLKPGDISKGEPPF